VTDEQKKKLEQKLWDVANTLRGKMNADEFRDYALGFIFYKYLSERLHLYANKILEQDGIDFLSIDEGSDEGQQILDAVSDASIDALGYFLKPSELFSEVAKRGSKPGQFILSDLATTLNNIQKSTMGEDSEDDFDNLFEDLDLTSTKLGRTEEAKNTLIAKILVHLDQIDFQLENDEGDVLGDAYEYMIGQFASGAGKKAGEFYTPQQVSTILARIVTTGKDRLKSVYDPTCGSGSLLLRVAREVEVSEFYGQELNRTTYNLARMNMILHGVHYRNFDLRQEDTLEHPQHPDLRAEAVVANPPFGADWAPNDLLLSDDRYAQYGRLAPKNAADFAFIQHMLHHLDDNGTMAVILPHGALWRSGAEQHIRKYIIEDRNWLDTIIGLPANIFYGTETPTCILVFKKCRENPENIHFIDASGLFDRITKKNILRPDHINRIVDAYRKRDEVDQFSRSVPISEIRAHKYNLNIPRYIDTFVPSPRVSLKDVADSDALCVMVNNVVDRALAASLKDLQISPPECTNVDTWKRFKLGVSQSLFAQEIRFHQTNGDQYPDWDKVELRTIANRITQKNVNSDIDRVLTNSATKGVVDQGDYFDKDIANSENLAGYYVVAVGDFVYNPRISTSAPVGPLQRNDLALGVMSPLYSVVRFHQKETEFYKHYFLSDSWHRYMKSVANYGARHDRMAITTGDLMAMPIPSLHADEQRKIANCLSLIDAKIFSLGEPLQSLDEFKCRFSVLLTEIGDNA
jgi:type I restriction enzyme M protein